MTEERKQYMKQYDSEHKEEHKQWYVDNKEELLEEAKQYYLDNQTKIKERQKQYRLENKDKQREYRKNRYNTNYEYRLRNIITSRINLYLKNNGQTKKDKTINYLGISISEYIIYLESLFTPEMNWNNYGTYWEIDHIIPCDWFNLKDPEQVKQCFNYKNTRPLYWRENREKSNKIIQL